MAAGYWMLYRLTGASTHKDKAVACLDWLVANSAKDHVGCAWGNHFDFVTRRGCLPAGTPIVVWTALIGLAFLAAYEATNDDRWLDVVRDVSLWILSVPREKTATGTCLSYVPFAQSSIHNSNILGAAMLASAWQRLQEPELLTVAKSAMLYSCNRQHEDGAWWYGEELKYHWIDSFHTGYNLDGLKRYIDATGDESLRLYLRRGLSYFKNVFFKDDGRPCYYHDRLYPIDIQCAAQAIETLAFCSSEDPSCLDLSVKVAKWTIDNMQDRAGFFYFRQYPLIKSKTPYIHWGQATMFKALVTLLEKLSNAEHRR
jgi:rhamnogalacturonyl hydrolase YesR